MSSSRNPLERFLRKSLRRNAVLELLRKKPEKKATQHYIKGVYNGNYFRIRVPKEEASRRLPKLPSAPTTVAPQAFQPSTAAATAATPHSSSPQEIVQQVLKEATSSSSSSWWKTAQQWWKANWAILVLNFGSICSLVGFTRSDVLELRALSMTGSTTFIVYQLTQSTIQWIPVAWSALFALVNATKIHSILQERRGTVHLTQEQERVFCEFFMPHGVTPKQFEHIYQKAKILKLKKNALLTKAGDPIRHVYLIVEGSTRANILGRRVTAASATIPHEASNTGTAVRQPPNSAAAWVGEMAFLDYMWESEHRPQPAQGPSSSSEATLSKQPSKVPQPDNDNDNKEQKLHRTTSVPLEPKKAVYTVVAKEDCTVLCWSHEDMKALLQRSTDMRSAMTRAMTSAIVGKVVNFTVSKTTALPNWSAWLDDWKYSGQASVKVKTLVAPTHETAKDHSKTTDQHSSE